MKPRPAAVEVERRSKKRRRAIEKEIQSFKSQQPAPEGAESGARSGVEFEALLEQWRDGIGMESELNKACTIQQDQTADLGKMLLRSYKAMERERNQALGEAKRANRLLAGKRSGPKRRQAGRYEFPKKYRSTKDRRDFMEQHANEMSFLKYLRRRVEKERRKDMPDTHGYIVGYLEIKKRDTNIRGKKLSGFLISKMLDRLRQWGYVYATGKIGYSSTSSGGIRQGSRYILGRQSNYGSFRPPWTWLEPPKIIPQDTEFNAWPAWLEGMK